MVLVHEDLVSKSTSLVSKKLIQWGHHGVLSGCKHISKHFLGGCALLVAY